MWVTAFVAIRGYEWSILSGPLSPFSVVHRLAERAENELLTAVTDTSVQAVCSLTWGGHFQTLEVIEGGLFSEVHG